MPSLNERLKDVFADAFETTPDRISDTLTADGSEAWDSMRSIVLATSIEETFDIQFSDDELVELDSFAKIRASLLAKGVPE